MGLNLAKKKASNAELVCVLSAIVSRIKARKHEYAIATGKDLLEAKALLPHGAFGPWIKNNLNWSSAQANAFMNAAKLVAKSPIIGKMKPTAVMALAAPNVPDAVKTEVISDLEAGKVPTPKEVSAKIKAAKTLAKPSKPKASKPTVEADLVERMRAAGPDVVLAAIAVAFPERNFIVMPLGGDEDKDAA
jgi:hypothetical protein